MRLPEGNRYMWILLLIILALAGIVFIATVVWNAPTT